jgi:glycosyltransferase involved in cell wall biosynthesis
MNIIFSLIVPTFNSHEDLGTLLASLFIIKNELDQVEIIIVDDGSCDDTEKIVRGFSGRFEELNYFFQKNRGPAAARNLGAKKARGKYLIFVDDDCLMPKGCIDAIKDFYKENTSYAGVGIKTVNSDKGIFSEFNQRLGDHLIESSKVSEKTYEYVSSRCYLHLKGFIKQNFIYGLGAGLLTQKHPNGTSFKFSRYKNMLLRISTDKDSLLQFKLFLAFILAQVCSLTGILSYKFNYDYKDRPPSVFPPRLFVFVETVKNLILSIPFSRSIKNSLGSLSTGEELFSAGSLAFSAQRDIDIYKDVISKEINEDNWMKGKRILEIGPGSHLGVPISFLAQGAEQVVAIDKYGEVKFRKKESQVYDQLLSQMSDESRERVFLLLKDLTLDKIKDFDKLRPLNYLPDTSIDSAELTQRLPVGHFDLIVSFNTLEHIKDLNIAFRNMKILLKQGGIAIHRVDAGSHYAVFRHTKNLLSQFLYSDRIWKMMFSQRSAPTRRILTDYIEIARSERFSVKEFCVDELANESEMNNCHRFLLGRFRCHSPEQVRKTGFILTARKN